MGDVRPHAAERDKLACVDYFLDQLARAVERGEVPRSSYDTLAPRYLARREELIAILTGASRAECQPAATERTNQSAPARGREVVEGWEGSAPEMGARPSRRPAPSREPVAWTTILLFLGAFLVIVASALFALAVWNTTGVLFRLGFLSTLTAAFYSAGYVARAKFGLRAGSVALTVVGSAMLLFDCWILISGYHLAGTLPWAAALFFCSAVYWFTEVRLGDGFYGVAGAAAQVGWWWLMASGLSLEAPVRLAGIALIALLWQLVAERAELSESVGSLATVLVWAAPVVTAAAALGIASDALLVGTSTWTVLGSAAIVSAAIAVVTMRSRLIPETQGRWIAGVGQIPLFIVVMLPGAMTWPKVAFMAAAAAVYALTAFSVGGVPFAVAAPSMELLAVLGALTVFSASDSVRVAVLAPLAFTWVLASARAERAAEVTEAGVWTGVAESGPVLEFAGFALLVGASILAPIASHGVPLGGLRLGAEAVVVSGVVLAAWAASALARRNPVVAFATALWSFYTLAAALAWGLPNVHSSTYALALLVLAAAWLPARGAMCRFYAIPEDAFGWAMRFMAFVIFIGGLAAEAFFFGTAATWQGVALSVAVSAFFVADAEFRGPTISAAVAGAVAVVAATLANAHAGGTASSEAVAGAAAAVLVSGAGVWLRAVRRDYAGWLAGAAALAATALCFTGAEGWALAGALAFAALAWMGTAVAAREAPFVLLGGLTAFAACGAALAAADASPIVAVIVLSLAGLALGMPAFFSATGPEGLLSRTGAASAVAGLLGLAWFAAVGSWTSVWGEVLTGARWLDIGGHGEAVVLLVLGAYVVVQAERWRIEPGVYGGYGVVLLALFAEMHAASFTTVELYSTSLGLYLVAMGQLFARRERERAVPPTIDLLSVLVALGVPALSALGSGGADSMVHVAWTVGLSIIAMVAGVVLRVRAYFFGGVVALALVVGWKSLTFLAQVWWLLLGLIGSAMLVIALTWEWQRTVISDARSRLGDSFQEWR